MREIAEKIKALSERVADLEKHPLTPVGETAGDAAYYRPADGSLRPPGDVYIDGLVGIGTDSPEAHLDVRGAIKSNHAAAFRNTANFPGLWLEHTGGTKGVILAVTGSDNFILQRRAADAGAAEETPVTLNFLAADDSLVLTAAGRVGLGTGTPNDKLEVYGGDADLRPLINVDAGNDVTWRIRRGARDWDIGMAVNDSFRVIMDKGEAGEITPLTITNQGNVGLNTTSPTQILEAEDARTGSDPIAWIKNLSNSDSTIVMRLDGGTDPSPTANTYISFRTFSGTLLGTIVGDGSGGVNYNTSSDRRLKQDIRPLAPTAADVARLQPVTYRGRGEGGRRQAGLIAQEVQDVFPELVAEVDGFLALDYARFTPHIISAVQDLDNRLAALERAE